MAEKPQVYLSLSISCFWAHDLFSYYHTQYQYIANDVNSISWPNLKSVDSGWPCIIPWWLSASVRTWAVRSWAAVTQGSWKRDGGGSSLILTRTEACDVQRNIWISRTETWLEVVDAQYFRLAAPALLMILYGKKSRMKIINCWCWEIWEILTCCFATQHCMGVD